MDRRLLIAGAALLVAAAATIGLALREPAPAPVRAGSATPDPTVNVHDRQAPALGERPALGPPEVADPRVRDHRDGARVAYDPEGRTGEKRTAQRLPPELVHALSKQLEAVMVDCTRSIGGEARGTRPQVTGAVFVDVAAGRLQVTETTLELRDLAGDQAATAKQCMEAGWVGQATAAPDGVAATHSEISVVFAVPAR